MAGVFVYTSTLGFLAGIFFASLFSIPREGVVLTLFLAVVFGLLWRQRKLPYASVLFLVSLFFLAISLGVMRLIIMPADAPLFIQEEGNEVVFEGVVSREPDVRSEVQHLYIAEEQTGALLLVTTDAYLEVSYGDRIKATGVLTRPENFETDLGRVFNYEGYLRAKGVTHRMSFPEVEVIEEGLGNPVMVVLFSVKQKLMGAIEWGISEPEAGLAEGLLLGIKKALGEDLESIFRRAGIIHIVVLSGYNVMLVAEAIMRLLSSILRPYARLVVGMAAISLFALMVGLSATVIRASVMAALVLVARATGRTYVMVRALVLTGTVMVILNPYLLVFDPGFQLSFMATLGLIFVAPLLLRLLGWAPTHFGVREFLTATIATQIMVLPLLLYLIGEFSVVSVIVNVLALPMVPIAMLLSSITALASLIFAPLGLLVGFIAHLSLAYIIAVASLFAALPFAAFVVPPFPFMLVIVVYGVMTLFLFKLWSRTTRKEHNKIDDLGEWELVDFEDYMRTLKNPEAANATSGFPFK